jgi:hypothetical protein
MKIESRTNVFEVKEGKIDVMNRFFHCTTRGSRFNFLLTYLTSYLMIYMFTGRQAKYLLILYKIKKYLNKSESCEGYILILEVNKLLTIYTELFYLPC